MLEINQYSKQNTNIFEVLCREELNLILYRLSSKDIRALMVVDRWCYENIPEALRCGVAFRSYRCLPPRKLQHGFFNSLDVTAARIECIPVVGYLVSIPRTFGGLFSSIYYGLQNDPDSKRHAIRGLQNFKRGLLNSIPLFGELWVTGNNFLIGVESRHVTLVKVDKLREFNIEAIQKALDIVKWIEYTQQNVLPYINTDFPPFDCSAKRVLLLQEMEEWQGATADDEGHALKFYIRNRNVTVPLVKEVFEIKDRLKELIEKEVI